VSVKALRFRVFSIDFQVIAQLRNVERWGARGQYGGEACASVYRLQSVAVEEREAEVKVGELKSRRLMPSLDHVLLTSSPGVEFGLRDFCSPLIKHEREETSCVFLEVFTAF
jgi:hypothetical protein